MSDDITRIMVVGLKEVDAGKTTVSRAALSLMRERGLNACGFKPKAGNNIWYDFDVVDEALSQGRLFGKDSKLLCRASGTDLPEEAISPFHRLLGVPPEHRTNGIPESLYFIADRVTAWEDDQEQTLVLNRMFDLDMETNSLLSKVKRNSDTRIEVGSSEKLNEVFINRYLRAIESAHELVYAESDAMVYESYADVALPWSGIDNLDMVLGVEPGFILEYDPEKYLQAARMYSNFLNEGTTRRIIKLLKPRRKATFPPSTTDRNVETAKEILNDGWSLGE